jgi:hypothetical protein
MKTHTKQKKNKEKEKQGQRSISSYSLDYFQGLFPGD